MSDRPYDLAEAARYMDAFIEALMKIEHYRGMEMAGVLQVLLAGCIATTTKPGMYGSTINIVRKSLVADVDKFLAAPETNPFKPMTRQ